MPVDGKLLLQAIRSATQRTRAMEALEKSEERYLLVNQVPTLVFKGYADWSVDFFNEKVEVLTGYSKEEFDSRRVKWCDVILPEDLDHASNVFTEALKTDGAYVQEHRIRRKDGEVRWIQCRGQIFRDPEGKIDYVSGVFFDINDRKAAEESLRATQERLQESEKTLRYFASQLLNAQEKERNRISRELHDDLGQSLLWLKLQAGVIDQKLESDSQKPRAECAAMLSCLDGLIDKVRRLSRDLSPHILEDLGITAALRYLFNEFETHYPTCCCSSAIDEIDELFKLEDQINIYRIFQEGLNNIGKYAQATRVSGVVSRKGDRVSFLVEDNGRGFDVLQAMTADVTGRGLGLASMQERVRMLGSELQLWSEEGKGTRLSFAINLPQNAGKSIAGN